MPRPKGITKPSSKRNAKKRIASALANPKLTKDVEQPLLEKRNGSVASAKAGREWQQQFWQGKSITDLSGIGCGLYTLGSPWLPSQYPSPNEMRLEIMTGKNGNRGGSIKLYCPKNYCGGGSDACFLVPAAHIEQAIVLPQQPTSTTKSQYHQVIIVPTAATGISTITRKYPQIISLCWPDKKADGQLQGKLGEAANRKQDTYLSAFKKAVNEQLAHYQKSVIDLTCEEHKGLLHCDAALSYTDMKTDEKAKIPGHLYFLGTGLLFLSVSTRVYLPLKSLSTVYSVIVQDMARAKKKKGETSVAVCLDIYMSVGEPFFANKTSDSKADDSGERILGFTRISLDLVDEVEEYVKKHGMELEKCEESYYDYEKDQRCTGWSPRV